MKRILVGVCGVAAALLVPACREIPKRSADHVFLNGGIYTADPEAGPSANLPILNADERVELATMIDAYTINVAYLMKHEEIAGSVQVGKRADLVVLDRNLFEIPAEEISEALVELTLFDGEVVHQSEGQPLLD